MKKCPKCNEQNLNQAKFCVNCGFSFKKRAQKRLIACFIFIGCFVLLYTTALYLNYLYEKKNMVPLITTISFKDNKCNVETKFDKEEKLVYINFDCDEKIEQWQKEVTRRQDCFANLSFKHPIETMTITSNNFDLKVGENLNFFYTLNDIKLPDYVKLKQSLLKNISDGNITISLPGALGFDKKVRNNQKKQYLAEKERQRQAAIQRARYREQLYNMLYNPYSYYGYY